MTLRPLWRLAICSALLYTLAFNLTFFIQELFLVVPKALTPGLRPTLFHNNHTWDGDHPLASLFQGTGALAILVSGGACVLLLRSGRLRSMTMRLFVVWMAFNGFFQALPQVVMGALIPGNDVGMAMDYFHLGGRFVPRRRTYCEAFTCGMRKVMTLHAVPTNPGERRISLAFNAIPTHLDSWGYKISFSG